MVVAELKAFLLPTLESYGEGKEHKPSELATLLGDRFGMSDEDQQEMLESGTPLGRPIESLRRMFTGEGGAVRSNRFDQSPVSRTGANGCSRPHGRRSHRQFSGTFIRAKEFTTLMKPAGEAEPRTGVGDDSSATPEERPESSCRKLRRQLA